MTEPEEPESGDDWVRLGEIVPAIVAALAQRVEAPESEAAA